MSETPQELIARPQGLVREASGKLTDFLARYRNQIIQILPKHLTPERVLKLIVGELNRSPSLLQCSPMSVVNCVLHAASLGLEIRPRSAYLIPFAKECQLLIDYRGKIDLALRSGLVDDMESRLVYTGDEFNIQFGTDPKMIHVPKFETEEPTLGYAVAWIKGAKRPHIEIMTVAQIEANRNKSRMKDGPAWKGHWDQMARKTIIHRICNYIPQSPEMAHSQDIDDAVDTGKPMASFLDVIEPADEKPMIEASPEEQKVVMERKLEEGRQQAHEKKEAKRLAKTNARAVAKVYSEIPDPLEVNAQPGDKIYVEMEGTQVLFECKEDRSAWSRVAQQKEVQQ